MKATGIVRRIDDLGRIVVPKEIRRTLRIREGDPLEIFTSREGEIMLKKYSPVGELGEFARSYAQALAQRKDPSCSQSPIEGISHNIREIKNTAGSVPRPVAVSY